MNPPTYIQLTMQPSLKHLPLTSHNQHPHRPDLPKTHDARPDGVVDHLIAASAQGEFMVHEQLVVGEWTGLFMVNEKFPLGGAVVDDIIVRRELRVDWFLMVA